MSLPARLLCLLPPPWCASLRRDATRPSQRMAPALGSHAPCRIRRGGLWPLVHSAHPPLTAALGGCVQVERGGEAMTYKELKTIEDMYLSPVFKWRPEEVEDLLEEAEIIRRRIDGALCWRSRKMQSTEDPYLGGCLPWARQRWRNLYPRLLPSCG